MSKKNRYRVFGHTTVTVSVDVTAADEEEAYDEAYDALCNLSSFFGNGGTDKLIGVYGECESVSADGEIVYDDAQLLGSAHEDEA